MNEMLATILFNNLIKNAYVHNRPNGSIHVLLTARAIRFSNTAAGEPLERRTYLPQVLPENLERSGYWIGIGARTRHLQNL